MDKVSFDDLTEKIEVLKIISRVLMLLHSTKSKDVITFHIILIKMPFINFLHLLSSFLIPNEHEPEGLFCHTFLNN